MNVQPTTGDVSTFAETRSDPTIVRVSKVLHQVNDRVVLVLIERPRKRNADWESCWPGIFCLVGILQSFADAIPFGTTPQTTMDA